MFSNPESSSLKGNANVIVGKTSGVSPAVNQVSGTTLGQTSTNAPLITPDGNVLIIDGGSVPPKSDSDDLIESILGGHVYSIGGKSGKLSPYIYLPATRSLTQNCRQAVAKACADTGSANNFASAGFIQKLGAKVISV